MSQTVSPSTSRSYGLARVSRAWSVSRAGVYRFLKRTASPPIARRRGPTGQTWLVARHGYKTPARVREEQTMPRIAIDPTFAATLPLAA